MWSTCSTLQHGDLTKAPFWLTPEVAETLPRIWRTGIRHGPKLWADRSRAEAAAVALHGVALLAERRRAALEQQEWPSQQQQQQQQQQQPPKYPNRPNRIVQNNRIV